MSDFWLVKKFPCPLRLIGKNTRRKNPSVSAFSWSLPVIILGSSLFVVYKSGILDFIFVFDPTNFQNTFGLCLACKNLFFSYIFVAFLVNLLNWFEHRLYSEYIFPSSVSRYLFHSLYFFWVFLLCLSVKWYTVTSVFSSNDFTRDACFFCFLVFSYEYIPLLIYIFCTVAKKFSPI